VHVVFKLFLLRKLAIFVRPIPDQQLIRPSRCNSANSSSEYSIAAVLSISFTVHISPSHHLPYSCILPEGPSFVLCPNPHSAIPKVGRPIQCQKPFEPTWKYPKQIKQCFIISLLIINLLCATSAFQCSRKTLFRLWSIIFSGD
jgi:hypothetical protein